MAKQSLVIVESPAKAKTIGKYLGKDYEVKACMGHLRDLQKSKLSVDVDNDFEPVYKPIKGKEAIISDLKKSAKAAYEKRFGPLMKSTAATEDTYRWLQDPWPWNYQQNEVK